MFLFQVSRIAQVKVHSFTNESPSTLNFDLNGYLTQMRCFVIGIFAGPCPMGVKVGKNCVGPVHIFLLFLISFKCFPINKCWIFSAPPVAHFTYLCALVTPILLEMRAQSDTMELMEWYNFTQWTITRLLQSVVFLVLGGKKLLVMKMKYSFSDKMYRDWI